MCGMILSNVCVSVWRACLTNETCDSQFGAQASQASPVCASLLPLCPLIIMRLEVLLILRSRPCILAVIWLVRMFVVCYGCHQDVTDSTKQEHKQHKQQKKKDWKRWFVVTHQHCLALPSEAEDEKGDAEESCHSMPDQGSGMARTEVEAKPEGSSQGKQLTRQKIHLLLERIRNIPENMSCCLTIQRNQYSCHPAHQLFLKV